MYQNNSRGPAHLTSRPASNTIFRPTTAQIDALSYKLTEKEISGLRKEFMIDEELETTNLKRDETSFLRGHVAQLTQSISQLSLKPGEVEIKKKGWWQFWK